MCSTDFDPCAVFVSSWVTARKPHRCVECRHVIPPGNRYRRVNLIMERGDRPEVLAIHAECEALREFIEHEICQPEEARVARQYRRNPDHGQILLGELPEEIHNLGEYSIGTPETNLAERDEVAALGFETCDDEGEPTVGPREVCEWLFGIIKAQYPKEAKL